MKSRLALLASLFVLPTRPPLPPLSLSLSLAPLLPLFISRLFSINLAPPPPPSPFVVPCPPHLSSSGRMAERRFNNYFPCRMIKAKSLCHFQFCGGCDGRARKCDLTSPLCSRSPPPPTHPHTTTTFTFFFLFSRGKDASARCVFPAAVKKIEDEEEKRKSGVIYKCIKNE